jgi:hypothetical protein
LTLFGRSVAVKVVPEISADVSSLSVVNGGYAEEDFQAAEADRIVAFARLRKDAALGDLLPVISPGQKQPRGRPPIYSQNWLGAAKRAGQT